MMVQREITNKLLSDKYGNWGRMDRDLLERLVERIVDEYHEVTGIDLDEYEMLDFSLEETKAKNIELEEEIYRLSIKADSAILVRP